MNTDTKQDPAPIAVNPDAAARMIGESRSTMYRLIREGAVTSYKSGRRRLVLVRSLHERAERLAEQTRREVA